MAAKVNPTPGPKATVHDGAMKQHVNDALCNEHGCQMSAMDSRNEVLEAALQSIAQWADAYPYKIFPEPDFGKVGELLKAGGITLDAVAASCMRHVVQGVGKIAKEALDAK